MIKLDMIIFEFMSGNIGIVLVMVCVVCGYWCVLIMFEMMSLECWMLLCVYGVEFIFILGVDGMLGVIVKVEELVKID